MNTAEQIVEAYFRYVRKCFTITDLKVERANNRQIDLLAFDAIDGNGFHVETSVTHTRWEETLETLTDKFEKKFFGAPAPRPENESPRTDIARGKNYFPEICQSYRGLGLNPNTIKRAWVAWSVQGATEPIFQHQHLSSATDNVFTIEIISMRDCIFPSLMAEIGSSNYDHVVLRTLSLISKWREQTS